MSETIINDLILSYPSECVANLQGKKNFLILGAATGLMLVGAVLTGLSVPSSSDDDVTNTTMTTTDIMEEVTQSI